MGKIYTGIKRHCLHLLSVLAILNFVCISGVLAQDSRYRSAVPVKVDTPPVIDGVLDDAIWKEAPVLSDYVQFEPDKGSSATVRTELRVLYDGSNMYFGFRCLDPEPDKIVIGTERDKLYMGTDSVDILIDTFHDMRSGYYFRTNPQGVQHDGMVSDNGRVADTVWDGVWQSAGKLNEEGWSAEMAIPFSTVKHRVGEDQTWGFQASRYLPRNMEKSFWTGPLEDYRKMDGNGKLTGLDLSSRSRRLELIPYVMTRFEKGGDAEVEAGLDARYDFTPSLSGHLTINPDFATVEADQEQVNLTRFELNLPEKRNFFMEGNAAYSQRINLFYSRRISDIYGGAKFYGKLGNNEVSVLTAQTREDDSGLDSANFSVFRIKRDILTNSSIGFLSANRLVDGRNQGTAGVDTALYFSETFKFTGQFALGYGDAGKTDTAFFLRPSHDTSTFHIHLRYTHLGEEFGDNVNAVGYIRDDNRNELDSAVTKTFWTGGSFLDKIDYKSNYNIYWGMDETLRSWDAWNSVNFDLKNKINFLARHEEEYKLFEKKFRNRQTTLGTGYNTREWQSASVSWTFGRNYDSDFHLVGVDMKRKLSENLSVEYGLSRLTLDPDPDQEGTWIHSLRATQYFNKDLYFKLFMQTNSAIDKRNVQAVFAWRFQPPFGQIQLAYQKGSSRYGVAEEQGDVLFIKLAFVL